MLKLFGNFGVVWLLWTCAKKCLNEVTFKVPFYSIYESRTSDIRGTPFYVTNEHTEMINF